MDLPRIHQKQQHYGYFYIIQDKLLIFTSLSVDMVKYLGTVSMICAFKTYNNKEICDEI